MSIESFHSPVLFLLLQTYLCPSSHFLLIADSLISLKKIASAPEEPPDSNEEVPIPTQDDDDGAGPEGIEGWAEFLT